MNGLKPRRKYDRAFKKETVRLVTEAVQAKRVNLR